MPWIQTKPVNDIAFTDALFSNSWQCILDESFPYIARLNRLKKTIFSLKELSEINSYEPEKETCYFILLRMRSYVTNTIIHNVMSFHFIHIKWRYSGKHEHGDNLCSFLVFNCSLTFFLMNSTSHQEQRVNLIRKEKQFLNNHLHVCK